MIRVDYAWISCWVHFCDFVLLPKSIKSFKPKRLINTFITSKLETTRDVSYFLVEIIIFSSYSKFGLPLNLLFLSLFKSTYLCKIKQLLNMFILVFPHEESIERIYEFKRIVGTEVLLRKSNPKRMPNQNAFTAAKGIQRMRSSQRNTEN